VTAQTPIWCGGSTADNNWSSPYNWCGKVPTAGTDTLQFGALVSGGYAVAQNNYASSPIFYGISFLSDSAAYTLQGYAVRLKGAIVNSSAKNQVINIPIKLDTGSGSIDTGNKTITISGVISAYTGTKSITKTGSGELILTASNTYTGDTNIDKGTLTLSGGDLADASAINVASGAIFKITSGTPSLGDIAGEGSTIITGTDTIVTAESVTQSILTIGAGAKLVIHAISSTSTDESTLAVPEPSTVVLILIGIVFLAALRKPRKMFLKS
jgi:autotransporter-associated beta strand protein